MKSTRLTGLHYWSEYQADRRIDFNGWFWERDGGNVVIDPMPLDADGLAFVRERGGARWILVTSAEHLRAAPELSAALDAETLAPAAERGRFGDGANAVHGWFEVPNGLPNALADDLEVFGLRGGKSPMEPCFHLRSHGALYFGDLVRSHVSGNLCLLPEPKLTDRGAVVDSLRELASLAPEAILLGDGDPILRGAGEAWRALHDSL